VKAFGVKFKQVTDTDSAAGCHVCHQVAMIVI